MNVKTLLGAVAGMAIGVTAAQADTLSEVKARGELNCLVNVGVPAWSYTDESGEWKGFDVDFCRATAAAIFDDPMKVSFTPVTGKTRFTALQAAEGDILYRNTTWTMSRDVDLKLNFAGVNYYDGQGFMINKNAGINSALELDGASICIQTGTTTELNLADYFRNNNMSYEPVAVESEDESTANYNSGRCDVYTTDASALAAVRSKLPNPDDHIILPEIISKEPLGPAVREGDDAWLNVASWVLNGLILAEEYGIDSTNIDELAKGTGNPNIDRMLGTNGNFGETLGLESDWLVQAIRATGNYAEIFERNIGVNTPVALERGLNASYLNGGIMYAPPIR
ncbi:MAG: amino acid ABC transporter substrate-binding protein [Alphaproteobacteria bacterium]